jgi:membrane-associated HD superfamily phosphohydrolase
MVFERRTRFLILTALLILLTTLLLQTSHSSALSENYKEGEVLTRAIVVPADIATIDLAETEQRRAVARRATRPIFNFDASRVESSVQSLRAGWEELKKQSSSGNKTPVWNGEGGPAVARAIIAHNFDEDELERLTNLVREIGTGFIYDDNDAERLQQEIVLVDVRNPVAQMIIPAPRTRMLPVSSARRNLELRILNLTNWTQEQKTALALALVPLIRPNVVLDQTATATARENEANQIQPVVITLKRNQVLAREGDTVTSSMLSQIAAIKNTGFAGRPFQNLIGLFIAVIAIYWAAWKFTEHRSSSSSVMLSKYRAFALVGSALLVETALMKVGFIFGDSIAAQRVNAPFNDPTIWNFAVPFAAGALLVAMLVDTQLAFLTGIITALFAGILAPSGMQKNLVRDDLVLGSGVRHRSLQGTSISDARRIVSWWYQRCDGTCSDSVFATASESQYFSIGGRLWTRRRFVNRSVYSGVACLLMNRSLES